MGSTPTYRAMLKPKGTKITIERLARGDAVAEGVVIQGPTTEAIKAFFAIYDRLGSDAIEGFEIGVDPPSKAKPRPHPGPGATRPA